MMILRHDILHISDTTSPPPLTVPRGGSDPPIRPPEAGHFLRFEPILKTPSQL